MIHRFPNHSEGNLNVPREQSINKLLLYSRDLQRALKDVVPAGQELNLCVRSGGGFEYEILEDDCPVAGGFAPTQKELAAFVSMSLTSFDPE
jgi:hypothetical protein